MQVIGFGGGNVALAHEGRHYTAALAAFTFDQNPDGSEHSALIRTAELSADDGGPALNCQAAMPLLGDRDAQRIMLRVLVAKGRAASVAAAVAAIRAAIQAAGGDVRFDPDNP